MGTKKEFTLLFYCPIYDKRLKDDLYICCNFDNKSMMWIGSFPMILFII